VWCNFSIWTVADVGLYKKPMLCQSNRMHNAVQRRCVETYSSIARFSLRQHGILFLARIALFNSTAHELHELYRPTSYWVLREALDRLRVRLNMYLVNVTLSYRISQSVASAAHNLSHHSKLYHSKFVKTICLSTLLSLFTRQACCPRAGLVS